MGSKTEFSRLDSLMRSEAFSVVQPLKADTRFADIAGWDSFKHLRFLLAVEEEFDFELSPEMGETLETLGDLAALVAKL